MALLGQSRIDVHADIVEGIPPGHGARIRRDLVVSRKL